MTDMLVREKQELLTTTNRSPEWRLALSPLAMNFALQHLQKWFPQLYVSQNSCAKRVIFLVIR